MLLAHAVDHAQIKRLLYGCLERQLSQDALNWLNEKLEQIASESSERSLFATFSAISRRTGKQDLHLLPNEQQAAFDLCLGWSPEHWSVDQAARTVLLLTFPHQDANRYHKAITTLFSTADVNELVVLYQSLPILPYPEKFLPQAADGLRTHMSPVFNAIALNNPYPAEFFDTPRWNQMVLKALFVGSSLSQIWGLDPRANPELARMLVDYAHERWAAKRPVDPELWRPVGPFITEANLPDLERIIANPDPTQQKAAALACSQSNLLQARSLLSQHPDLQSVIDAGDLSWNSLYGAG